MIPITIIGGGPVGSLLACGLAAHGIAVRLVDRVSLETLLSDTTSDHRAIALSPASKNLLDGLGIWQSIQEHVQPILDVQTVHGSTGSGVSFNNGGHCVGYIVPMSFLRQTFAQRVSHFVHQGIIEWVVGELESFEKNPYTLTVILKEGERFDTGVVIGADGKNSKVRQLGGFDTIAWDYGKEAIICTYSHTNDHQGIAWEIFMPEGPFAILPMTKNRSSIVWSVQKDIAQALMDLSDQAFNAIITEKMTPYLEGLTRVSQRWTYPIGIRLAKQYVKDSILLIGDAAHVMHPLAGQGVNMGFRDVAALIEIFAQGDSLGLSLTDATLHKNYEAQRRFDNLSMTVMTDAFDALFSNQSKTLEKVREYGMKMVSKNQGLQSLFKENAMGKC